MEKHGTARLIGAPSGYVGYDEGGRLTDSQGRTVDSISEAGRESVMADLNKRLADRRVTGQLDPKAKEWVAEKGYDSVFGARPLKRFLQRNLETKFARALIAGELGEDSVITFTVQNDELTLVHAPDAAART